MTGNVQKNIKDRVNFGFAPYHSFLKYTLAGKERCDLWGRGGRQLAGRTMGPVGGSGATVQQWSCPCFMQFSVFVLYLTCFKFSLFVLKRPTLDKAGCQLYVSVLFTAESSAPRKVLGPYRDSINTCWRRLHRWKRHPFIHSLTEMGALIKYRYQLGFRLIQ